MSRWHIVGDIVVIGLGSALLWHLTNIWRFGQHLIQEPNTIILVVETIGCAVFVAFGLIKIIIDSKRTLKDDKNTRNIRSKID